MLGPLGAQRRWQQQQKRRQQQWQQWRHLPGGICPVAPQHVQLVAAILELSVVCGGPKCTHTAHFERAQAVLAARQQPGSSAAVSGRAPAGWCQCWPWLAGLLGHLGHLPAGGGPGPWRSSCLCCRAATAAPSARNRKVRAPALHFPGLCCAWFQKHAAARGAAGVFEVMRAAADIVWLCCWQRSAAIFLLTQMLDCETPVLCYKFRKRLSGQFVVLGRVWGRLPACTAGADTIQFAGALASLSSWA